MLAAPKPSMAAYYGVKDAALFNEIYLRELAKLQPPSAAGLSVYDVASMLVRAKTKREFHAIIQDWLKGKEPSEKLQAIKDLYGVLFGAETHIVTEYSPHVIFSNINTRRIELAERIVQFDWPATIKLSEDDIRQIREKVADIEAQLPSTPLLTVEPEELVVEQGASDETRIKLQAIDRLRAMTSLDVPIDKEAHAAVYSEFQKQAEQLVVDMSVDREDTTQIKKLQALLPLTYEEWMSKDPVQHLEDIAGAVNITSTQADMMVQLTNDRSFWYSMYQNLGGLAAITMMAFFQYISNSDFVSLVPYILGITAIAGVEWIAKFLNRFVRATTTASIAHLSPQGWVEYLRQSNVAKLYKNVGDFMYNNRAPLFLAWTLIVFTIPVLFKGWMESAASASMLSATAILTQTVLPLLQQSAVRALAFWGFSALRTGVTDALVQSKHVSTELKTWLVKLGPKLDGVFLAVFFMAAPKAVNLLSRLFGELLPSTVHQLYNAIIQTPPDLTRVSILGDVVLDNGQPLRVAVSEALQGPTTLASSVVGTQQMWSPPEMTQALQSATTQTLIGPQFQQAVTPVRTIVEDIQSATVQYVVNGDKIVKQLNTGIDERVVKAAEGWRFSGVDVCKWFSALGPFVVAPGGRNFATRAAGPITSGMYLFCDAILNGQIYV